MSTHYQTLGVEPTASLEDIKKAFRSLALKLHPDQNQDNPTAEEDFKRVNEAYQVLSDVNKRKEYDRRLNNPDENVFEIDEDSFPFGGGFSWAATNGFGNNARIVLSLEDLLNGCTKKVNINLLRQKIVNNKFSFEQIKQEIEIKLPPGLQNQGIIFVETKIEDKLEKVIVHIDILTDGCKVMPNGDVVKNLSVSYPVSILGGLVEVENLFGKKEMLRVPENTKPGMLLSVAGQGLPRSPHDLTRGSLLYAVAIDIPNNLDEEAKEILRQFQNKLEQLEKQKAT